MPSLGRGPRSQGRWVAEVTAIVDRATGGTFDWSIITEADWESWRHRRTFVDAVAESLLAGLVVLRPLTAGAKGGA